MASMTRHGPVGRGALLAVLALLAFAAASCGSLGGTEPPKLTIQLRTLNASGVTGTVSFTELRGGRTRVAIVVDPGTHLDMPAHIHPGTCDNLVPQPKYPLENVRNGESTTEIPATVGDLLSSRVAVNLHASVSDLATYTACAEIR
jgi:hypothetical protein